MFSLYKNPIAENPYSDSKELSSEPKSPSPNTEELSLEPESSSSAPKSPSPTINSPIEKNISTPPISEEKYRETTPFEVLLSKKSEDISQKKLKASDEKMSFNNQYSAFKPFDI